MNESVLEYCDECSEYKVPWQFFYDTLLSLKHVLTFTSSKKFDLKSVMRSYYSDWYEISLTLLHMSEILEGKKFQVESFSQTLLTSKYTTLCFNTFKKIKYIRFN